MIRRWFALIWGLGAACLAAPSALAQPPGTILLPPQGPSPNPLNGAAPNFPDGNSPLRGLLDATPNESIIPVPLAAGRVFTIAPRYGLPQNVSSEKDKQTGIQRVVYTGGLILHIGPGLNQPEMEFATDSAVVWFKGKEVAPGTTTFEVDPEKKEQVEIYMTGSVVIRMNPKATATGLAFMQTLRANEIYYDVTNSKAIALNANLEMTNPRVPDGIHVTGKEIQQLDEENWEVIKGSAFSTKLPSDPGLRFDSPRVSLREHEVIRENIFGIPYRDFDGKPVEGMERLLTIRNSIMRVNGFPVFYWPYLRTDLSEPLGPLMGFGGGQDRIFGSQIYTSWDMWKLLALRPPPGHNWKLYLDYLSDRGPGVGTDYYYTVPSTQLGNFPPGQGTVRLYGIDDGGVDQIGGNRGPLLSHPEIRGRALWRQQQDIMEGMYFQGQIAYLSDQNYLEQFNKQEFDYLPMQETFAYLTYQQENLWSSGLISPRLGQDWMTRTEWLPRVDGSLLGESFLDRILYNVRGNAGYAQLSPASVAPFPVLSTDRPDNTARLDLNQDVSIPFDAGPFKFAPYATLDLTYYSSDLNGNSVGRVYGGGGLRGNLPFSRLYDNVSSDLFNVNSLYHKATLSTNYYYAQTNVPYSQLPLLDRLDDDATDYTYRYIRPAQTTLVPGPAGVALATSNLFNQQLYAIRRLVDDRVDTLGNIDVLQTDLRQRLQTKRGYPGLEHTVDLLVFDVSASYFPQANRDNFGKSWAFLEYNGLWNIGDRTSVLSQGWFDPFENGTRYWNLGMNFDRPNRTNIYVGYRQTDPLNSKAVTASIGYQLSNRYYTNIGASYDFGIQQAMSNTLSFTRTGSDMTVMIGFTYNALVNNFGFNFLIVPNIVSAIAPGKFGSMMGGQAMRR